MRRNLDLCRQILLTLEAQPPEAQGLPFDRFQEDADTVTCHLVLLQEAGLIDAIIEHTMDSPVPWVLVRRLTWQGHDFLDACREESTWQKAKDTLREKVGSAAFGIVIALLTDMAKKKLGL